MLCLQKQEFKLSIRQCGNSCLLKFGSPLMAYLGDSPKSLWYTCRQLFNKVCCSRRQNEKVGERANAFQKTSCQDEASFKSYNLLTFAGAVSEMIIPAYIWAATESANDRLRHIRRHASTCHLIPAADICCEDIIQRCHQPFVQEKERFPTVAGSWMLEPG